MDEGEIMIITRIAICGIPCSGTKLMNHMLASVLPTWDYDPIERPWHWEGKQKFVITKQPKDVFKQDIIRKYHNIAPVIMVRDPWFVLTSKHRTPKYWNSAEKIGFKQFAPIKWYEEIIKQRDKGAFIVKYEELVTNPCEIQGRMLEQWDLPFEGDLTDFAHTPLPPGLEYLGVVRPLSTSRLALVPEDKVYLKKQVKICPDLYKVRKELGYANISLS